MKYILLLAVSVIAAATAQVASVPQRIRKGKSVDQQPQDEVNFGRYASNSNLRKLVARELDDMSMSMSMDIGMIGLGPGEDDDSPIKVFAGTGGDIFSMVEAVEDAVEHNAPIAASMVGGGWENLLCTFGGMLGFGNYCN